jgi:hypothetical protein
MCLRTAINKIDLLAGKKLCSECHKAGGHTPSCSKHPPRISYTVARLLSNASDANDLCQAVEQGGNVPEAVREYRKRALSTERIAEYVQMQRVPMKLQSGDLIDVGHRTYTLLDTPSEVEKDESGSLCLTLRLIGQKPVSQTRNESDKRMHSKKAA